MFLLLRPHNLFISKRSISISRPYFQSTSEKIKPQSDEDITNLTKISEDENQKSLPNYPTGKVITGKTLLESMSPEERQDLVEYVEEDNRVKMAAEDYRQRRRDIFLERYDKKVYDTDTVVGKVKNTLQDIRYDLFPTLLTSQNRIDNLRWSEQYEESSRQFYIEKAMNDPRSDPEWRDPETGLSIDEQMAQNRAVIEEADKQGILWDIDDLDELPGFKAVKHTKLHDRNNIEHQALKQAFRQQIKGPNEGTMESEAYLESRGKTIDNPYLVTGSSSQCIVGCVCDKDESCKVNWFYLEEGPVQQCNCGFYYKLNKTSAPNAYGEIMSYDEEEMIKRDMRRSRRQQESALGTIRERRFERRMDANINKLPYNHPDRLYLEKEKELGIDKDLFKTTKALTFRNTVGAFFGAKQYDPAKDEELMIEAKKKEDFLRQIPENQHMFEGEYIYEDPKEKVEKVSATDKKQIESSTDSDKK